MGDRGHEGLITAPQLIHPASGSHDHRERMKGTTLVAIGYSEKDRRARVCVVVIFGLSGVSTAPVQYFHNVV